MTADASPSSAATPAATRLARQVARQIVEQALAGRYAPDEHLAELALAARFRVSRTPVRAALQLLHAQGLLRHAERKGYTLRASRERLLRAQRELPLDEADTLYYRLLRDRTAGTLAELVTEREIEQAYGVRRAVVHDVMMRLLQHGILRGRRHQRWEFAETLDSAESERESYRFRLMLECHALLEPGFQVDPARFEACRDRQQQLITHATRRSWLDFFEANAEFHELLADASGNRFVLRAVQEQNRLRRVADLSDYPLVDVELLRTSCREHLQILDAVARGKLDVAARHMREHLQRASDVLEQRVAGKI